MKHIIADEVFINTEGTHQRLFDFISLTCFASELVSFQECCETNDYFLFSGQMHQILAHKSTLGCCMTEEHNRKSKTISSYPHCIEDLFLDSKM